MSKPPPKPAKPGQVKVFRALYTFDPRTPDELFFEEGDFLYISDTSDSNWWKGTCRGRTGLIPSNYVAEHAESIDNPMHEAAKRGNLSWLRECVENKVAINGLDKAGNTPLYWACHGGHKEVVEVLLSQPNVELNQQVRCVQKNSFGYESKFADGSETSRWWYLNFQSNSYCKICRIGTSFLTLYCQTRTFDNAGIAAFPFKLQ
ncbi:osteoclast-stimulating factor 1 [Epinephelus moara]|uniref:osteoclast-stimulating factor 1 n=1 Tax=Epinephelus moara TaxID=300413 RepID=UPI00214EC2F7|nr:osteoclast-stimulating factor 1 [Epinephelus moara]